MPNRPQREFGTFLVRPGGVLQDLATPFWHWGQFYENVIRTVLNGGWVRDKSGTDGRAVNYWWGMNSGVMDVLLSRELPPDVTHLAQILRTGVTSGMIDPFHCRITGQDGSVKNSGRHGLDLEQIAHMDWLCDAVDGTSPNMTSWPRFRSRCTGCRASTAIFFPSRRRPSYEDPGRCGRGVQGPLDYFTPDKLEASNSSLPAAI